MNLSDKARKQLAALALTLAIDDVYAANLEDQLAKLNTGQQSEYLEPVENKYAEVLIVAVDQARQELLLDRRDSPMDWLAWRLAPDLLRRTFGGRT